MVSIMPYEKMYMIDETEYMRLKDIAYPEPESEGTRTDYDDDDDDDGGVQPHATSTPIVPRTLQGPSQVPRKPPTPRPTPPGDVFGPHTPPIEVEHTQQPQHI